jgi:flagellar biosynthesis anti-sigma factor FlgM
MKLDNSLQQPPVLQATNSSAAPPTPPTTKIETPVENDKRSEEYHVLKSASAELATTSDVDTQKVNSIKELLGQPGLSVDLDALADAILGTHG